MILNFIKGDFVARLPTALHCILPAGHTIGTPSPLVEEIKPALVEQLKAKYQVEILYTLRAREYVDAKIKSTINQLRPQGKQSERGDTTKAAEVAAAPAKADAGIIADLEAQVAAQGNKVLLKLFGNRFNCTRIKWFHALGARGERS